MHKSEYYLSVNVALTLVLEKNEKNEKNTDLIKRKSKKVEKLLLELLLARKAFYFNN